MNFVFFIGAFKVFFFILRFKKGGGGARGCSHVGMIKAILEAGIPIDSVAGVSIGSLIGGLYCQVNNSERVRFALLKYFFLVIGA